MQIKVNEKIICIPPFISTNWVNVSALHMKGNILSITLKDGNVINIPDLSAEVLELIFSAHAASLDHPFAETDNDLSAFFKKNNVIEQLAGIRFGIAGLDGIGIDNAMQHNPDQANAPDLPDELLHKITGISKILAVDELMMPKAEPSCNCFHCQIARALNPQANAPQKKDEIESIKDEELTFQQWNISQAGDNLFTVINRLDENEKYSVYLGNPLGCTCGKEGCEHIIAVLKS